MRATSGEVPVTRHPKLPPMWRQVAIPTEHGGWSLTAEPVVLGLVVAWSSSGLLLGLAAMLAFLARSPIKVVLVDRWRHRRLERTRLAERIAVIELLLVATLLVAAAQAAEPSFWVPLAAAAPLLGVELWFDMRSRSRRLVPELTGTIGIGSVVAAIVLAAGAPTALAIGMWLVVSARAVAAVPYARTQVMRTHGRPVTLWHSDLAQVVAVSAVGAGWVLDSVPLASVAAIAFVGGFNAAALRRSPKPAVVIGVQQMTFGIAVLSVTAVAVLI